MELALHADKKGALVPSEPTTVEDAESALAQIQDSPAYRPLVVFANINNATDMLPLMSGVERLQPSSRGLVLRICEFLSESSNFSKSQTQMCKELKFNIRAMHHIERVWPHFWRFINLVVRRAVRDRTEARVEGATAQGAIHGNDRDRRLYYEVHGRLKKREDRGGGGSIIFVNNIIDRPSPPEPVTVVTALPDAEPSTEP